MVYCRVMKKTFFSALGVVLLSIVASSAPDEGPGAGQPRTGDRLFNRETFGGNGRTCRTCHGEQTGTVSAKDARDRFRSDPADPLFIHDGSDDGLGHGTKRIRKDATILMTIPLAANVTLAADPGARSVVVRRGIATTLNTPALDPVLMLDGRQPTLESQAMGAITDHAQSHAFSAADLRKIAEFELTDGFFSSPALRNFARGGPNPGLPEGRTESEKRGRRFFVDGPPDPTDGFRPGLCAHCHSGPLLNQANEFATFFIGEPIPIGARFMNVAVSDFNAAGNPWIEFIFNKGTLEEKSVTSPDPGRALTTGDFDDVNVFKTSPLRGIRLTAPYFHDNSAKTLEDVAAHYTRFFTFVTGGLVNLTLQDEQDMVAFMKLLD
jgi:cytochrome c peroxidase